MFKQFKCVSSGVVEKGGREGEREGGREGGSVSEDGLQSPRQGKSGR